MTIKSRIRTVPHYPKKGVMFRDITTLLKDPVGFRVTINELVNHYTAVKIDKVAGIESRGFIIGGAVALAMGAGFVPVRKGGRLPAATIAEAYSLEYGEAVIEVHADAIASGQRVLIVDDLLATGGTAAATAALVERLGGRIVGMSFLIELSELQGGAALSGHPYSALLRL